MTEEGLHIDAQGFVVALDARPGGRLAALTWAAEPGEDRVDHLIAQDAERGDRACRLRRDAVAT